MSETITLADVAQIEIRNRTRKAAQTIYHVVSGRPEADVIWNEKAPTASHSPKDHGTTFTMNVLPQEARSRPFLALELLQGAAAHEAAHHRTLETFELETLLEYFKEPIIVPVGTHNENLKAGPFARYAEEMQTTMYRLVEDIHCNDWLALRWGETYGRSLQHLVRYTRRDWIEQIRWQVRYYEVVGEVYGSLPQAKSPGSKLLESSLGVAFDGNRISIETGQDKFIEEYMAAGGLQDEAEALTKRTLLSLLTSAFQVWFVYRPTPTDIERTPALDLTPILTRLWALMSKAEPFFLKPWPETPERFLEITDSMKREGRRGIGALLGSGVSESDDAILVYRALVLRYFKELFEVGKILNPKDRESAQQQAQESSAKDITPEGQSPPGGTSESRDRAEKEERRIRKQKAADGDEAANDAEDSMNGGPDPFEVIDDWMQRHGTRRGNIDKQVRDLKEMLRGPRR